MTTEAPPPPDETSGGSGASEVPAKHPGGRPSKLTKAVTTRLFNAMRRGHPQESAADFAGIRRSTLQNWLARGEEDQKAGRDTEYAEFLDRFRRVDSQFVDKHLRRIDAASAGRCGVEGPYEWRASLGLLGRRKAEHFAERKGVELTGKGGGAIQVERKDPRQMTEEELEAELAAAAAAGALP